MSFPRPSGPAGPLHDANLVGRGFVGALWGLRASTTWNILQERDECNFPRRPTDGRPVFRSTAMNRTLAPAATVLPRPRGRVARAGFRTSRSATSQGTFIHYETPAARGTGLRRQGDENPAETERQPGAPPGAGPRRAPRRNRTQGEIVPGRRLGEQLGMDEIQRSSEPGGAADRGRPGPRADPRPTVAPPPRPTPAAGPDERDRAAALELGSRCDSTSTNWPLVRAPAFGRGRRGLPELLLLRADLIVHRQPGCPRRAGMPDTK